MAHTILQMESFEQVLLFSDKKKDKSEDTVCGWERERTKEWKTFPVRLWVWEKESERVRLLERERESQNVLWEKSCTYPSYIRVRVVSPKEMFSNEI